MGGGEPQRSGSTTTVSRASLGLPRPACAIWGVLNVTPDSFSDGGRYADTDAAVARGVALARDGADVVDVGGESSRPAGKTYGDGFSQVPVDEEIARVVPVVERLVGEHRLVVSVDTVKPEVARRALEAGATTINDVSCGRSQALLEVVGAAGADLVLMHTRGRGEVTPPHTDYDDVVADVLRELSAAVERAVEAGVAAERVWLDPGIGFAKTAAQSARLLAATPAFVATGHRVLVGPSRKSFIAEIAPFAGGGRPAADEREAGTAAAVTAAVLGGAHAVRVHDVRGMRQAVLVAEALREERRA